MKSLISAVVGAVVGSVLVLGGTATIVNTSASDEQKTDPTGVGYADQ